MSNSSKQLSPAQKVAREEITAAFREVFSTASGKRVLFWMLEQCAVYEDAYSGDMTNATHYRLGQQGAGRRLIRQLDSIDPTLYPRLLLAVADLREQDKAHASTLADNEEGEEIDVLA
jgi:hypothetical protein